jgi:hypothetical protein
MMGLPASQVDQVYWLPWYNSTAMDTQLRIANISAGPAQVHVYIGITEVAGSPFTIPRGVTRRLSFAGFDRGPLKIVSNADIVPSARVIYRAAGGVPVSYSETMALPAQLLDTIYWLPWYNGRTMDSQLRIANTTDTPAMVHVRVGGVDVPGSPFPVPARGSVRKTFPSIDQGPLQIESNADVVASTRVIYKAAGVVTSFSEMLALPDGLLDAVYWFPWYNHKTMDTQLRFGVP